jgi:hypothetical protein
MANSTKEISYIQIYLIDYRGVAIKLDTSDLTDDFISDYFDDVTATTTSLANRSALTRHQAGISTTMPNAL